MWWIILGILLYIGGGIAGFIVAFRESECRHRDAANYTACVTVGIVWPVFAITFVVFGCIFGPTYIPIWLALRAKRGPTKTHKEWIKEFERWKAVQEDVDEALENMDW